jgi:very-short-patch-repair endonuclease
MGNKGDIDHRIAAIATRQHGVITHRQLGEAGLGRSGISRRAARNGLHRVHRGVYAVGHAGLSDEGRWMAAVLACGRGAVLSHAAAASLWGVLRPLSGPVDVSVPTRAGRREQRGIRLHRCGSLAEAPKLMTVRRGIAVTTPARTLADLPQTLPPRLVRRARRQAEVIGLPLGFGVATDRTRSDLEHDFLRLCRRNGLPAPEVNVRLGSWTVDFHWPGRGLVVETDGYRYHRGEAAFEEDRVRGLGLRAMGFEVIRLSGRQLSDESGRIVEILRGELAP